MELLTPFQQEILKAVGRSPLGEDFYLMRIFFIDLATIIMGRIDPEASV